MWVAVVRNEQDGVKRAALRARDRAVAAVAIADIEDDAIRWMRWEVRSAFSAATR